MYNWLAPDFVITFTNTYDHKTHKTLASKNGSQLEDRLHLHNLNYCKFFHCNGIYGQLKELPLSNISLIRVSIGVFPTKRTKNNCSITWELTVLRDGKRSNNLPNLVGWFGYWVLQYSSKAHWDFSWRLSICATSDKPQASEII